MVAWAAAPGHEGFIDKANLTASSFTYYGPHGSVPIQSLLYDFGVTRAQMDAKADALLAAAGFTDWDTDGTRNDPRKVAGPDKSYGTGDDVKTAASNLDPLIFYIRLDDPDRRAAGEKLAADLDVGTGKGIPISIRVQEKTVCFKNVMVDYNYHLYTGGYGFGADPPDIQYGLWSSTQYWYPTGWSGGYQGFCHVLMDQYLEDVRFGSSLPDDVLPGVKNATFIQNKYACSIPLWSSASANAYRTGWDGVVNVPGYGISWGVGGIFGWSLFNMRPTPAGPYDPDDTVTLGFKSNPEDLHAISSEWVWDAIVLDQIYASLIRRNPYNLGKDEPWLVDSWTVTTYAGGTKMYIDFDLRDDVYFHDNSPLMPADVKWSAEFQKACGPGVIWGYSTVKDIINVTVTNPAQGGTVRFYMDSAAAFTLHDVGYLYVLNRKVWDAADSHYGWSYNNDTRSFAGDRFLVRNFHPHSADPADDFYNVNTQSAGSDGLPDLAGDGAGPWVFLSPGPDPELSQFIDLVAFRPGIAETPWVTQKYHETHADVDAFINDAFHGIGNVNYPGSVREADYNGAGIGTDVVIDVIPDLQLIERASGCTSGTCTAGIGWNQWNVDADITANGLVDVADYSLAAANLLKTAG
jgi:ABC-type transport system substrate-binding protein